MANEITDLDDVAEALGLTELRRAVEDVKGVVVEILRRQDALVDTLVAGLGVPAPDKPGGVTP